MGNHPNDCPDCTDEDSKALHGCRTLDEVLVINMRRVQKKCNLDSSLVPLYEYGFYSGASAVVGLMEMNGVSMVAIQAMLELHLTKRQQAGP